MLFTLAGYDSNGLLGYPDYDLIRASPKILRCFSDITALATAIYDRTGFVTYSGPHFSTLGMRCGLDYTLKYFERCVMREEPFGVPPADHWSHDPWYPDQENRDLVSNPGYEVVHEGEAEGRLLGETSALYASCSGSLSCRTLRDPCSYWRTTRRSCSFTSTGCCNRSSTSRASRGCGTSCSGGSRGPRR